ncbi:hypothetical protein Micbo1qcDRAFT_207740 [Microdochium bolleyi]|uniref:F-box domain-containing protein n=1 Tax=Microdochium bolleyi TaxID=196109 RepID=A0A136ISY7_9PEZI|nr:hypothetical protein Micbo1qcDRAFT_207740 [Microdochium bolleyi]
MSHQTNTVASWLSTTADSRTTGQEEQQQQQQYANINMVDAEDIDMSDAESYFSELSDTDSDNLSGLGIQHSAAAAASSTEQHQSATTEQQHEHLAGVLAQLTLDKRAAAADRPALNPPGTARVLFALPRELLHTVLADLSQPDLKALRLSCTGLAGAVELRIPRVFLSASSRNVQVCLAIARHPVYRERVREIVWDAARLPEDRADAMWHYRDLRPRVVGLPSAMLRPVDVGAAAAAAVPVWFRDCQALNDVRLIDHDFRQEQRWMEERIRRRIIGRGASVDRNGGSGGRPHDRQAAHADGTGAARRRPLRLREAVAWAERGSYELTDMAVFFEQHLRGYKMLAPDVAATKASRDWDYYQGLLRDQREVEESGAHIDALATALAAFTRLQTVTVSYHTHGRGGTQPKPVHETPMIRAFPHNFNYPVPLGWVDDSPHARIYGALPISQMPDSLSIVLRQLVTQGLCKDKNDAAEEEPSPLVELRIDDGGLGRGVDFGALTHSGCSGRSRADLLSQIMAQPGFEGLCLQMAGLTLVQCARYFDNGKFGDLLGQANGGRGLRKLELACNPTIPGANEPQNPTMPLARVLRADNVAALRHLSLSHMLVHEGELVGLLAMLPGSIRTIELFHVRLRSSTGTVGGQDIATCLCWQRVVEACRRRACWRWAWTRRQGVLRVGTRDDEASSGHGEAAMGRRRWLSEALAGMLGHSETVDVLLLMREADRWRHPDGSDDALDADV